MHTHNTEGHLHNNCCCGKAINIYYSERVPVTFVIQHTKGKHRIIQSFETWLALKLYHKWHDFWKKRYGRIVCVCVYVVFFKILSTNSLKQFSFKEVLSLILYKLHKHLHVKYQLFLSHFSETPYFDRFSKDSH